jgi:hypothetical protein
LKLLILYLYRLGNCPLHLIRAYGICEKQVGSSTAMGLEVAYIGIGVPLEWS